MSPTQPDDQALKKGTAELLILAQLEHRPSHGYEIAQRIDVRSRGTVSFHVASLYPILYRLERRALIQGRWIEKSGERRRRFYRLTTQGAKRLAIERRSWSSFLNVLTKVARLRQA